MFTKLIKNREYIYYNVIETIREDGGPRREDPANPTRLVGHTASRTTLLWSSTHQRDNLRQFLIGR
jgi:hypothetical protein